MIDTFEVDLDRMAHGGMAMGRYQGQAVFVPRALPGERVRVHVTERKERVVHAAPLEILRPSPAREMPRCEHFVLGASGPDPWQIIEYTHQLRYKREILTDQLQRLGDIKDPVVHPVIESPEPWGYRTQMTFAMARTGQPGYWADDRQTVLPAEGCHVLHSDLYDMLSLLDLEAPGIKRVRFQIGTQPDDRMIIIEASAEDAPEIEVDLPLSINLLLPDNEPVNLIGSSHVTYQILDRTFRVTAGAYFHPNPAMVPTLLHEVLARLDPDDEESVLELYSGVGLLTAFIAQRAGLVVSVESYPPAVTDADDNTADLENIDLVEGAAEEVLDELEGPFGAVVVDPTPAGLSSEVVEALGRLNAPKLVYVSYDPASLARDVKRLARSGYRLLDVQPIDMTPQAPYITSVASLGKR